MIKDTFFFFKFEFTVKIIPMKRITISVFFASFLFLSCTKSVEILPGIISGNKEPKGAIINKEFSGDFDEIKVATGITAELIKSDVEKVVLSAPSDVIKEVLVENSNGRMYIHVKHGFDYKTDKISAKIYTRDFTALEANSGGRISTKEKFTQEKTDIDVSSSGSISGNYEANDLSIDASSGGNFSGKIWAVNFQSDLSSGSSIDANGKAKNANISSSSGGSFSGNNIVVENATTDASSGSSISLSVSHKLNAVASSGGSVNVKKAGSLTEITKEENSGGSISVN